MYINDKFYDEIDTILGLLKLKLNDVQVWKFHPHMNMLCNEKMIKVIGLSGKNAIPIKSFRNKDKTIPKPNTIGHMLFQQQDTGIKYVVSYILHTDYYYTYLTIAKGQLYKLTKKCYQLYKRLHNTPQKPILDPALWNSILMDTVGFYRKYRNIKNSVGGINRGILLYGPPGNGKSMICEYIQSLFAKKALGVSTVTNAELTNAYASNKLHTLLNKSNLVVFDDIDISFLNRRSGDGRLACELLSAMDGNNKIGGSVRIFTTNENTVDLDTAFLRPGRIDKKYHIGKPSKEQVSDIIDLWHNDVKALIPNINLLKDKLSNNFSCAEINAVRTNLLLNEGINIEQAINWVKEDSFVKQNKLGF